MDDEELIREAYRRYDADLAEHVGEVVTPYDYVETEKQVEWVARIFMFAYALGSLSGAEAATGDSQPFDLGRVDDTVGIVADLDRGEQIPVSFETITSDFGD